MALNLVREIDDSVKIKNIIVSVSDKSGLDIFAADILKSCPDAVFYSTGGTYRYLSEIDLIIEGRNLISISDYTNQPEMQGGLVKTLDFKIYTGILSETYNSAHQADLKRTKSTVFDMAVVNLYPFRKTIESSDTTPETARTNIDIGGPCMLRASAKNFLRTVSVCDPSDYENISAELKNSNGKISLKTRKELAVKTFLHTSEYDNYVYNYFAGLEISEIGKCYEIH